MTTVTASALVDEGFEALSAGTLENAGQNLYVSKAGVLQRIFYSSVSGSGYVDLPFANTHDDAVRVSSYLYTQPLVGDERIELDSDGLYAMAVADLTGDGYDDIVFANQYNGATNEVHAQVYYGSADGYSRSRMIRLWAPCSKDVAVGRVRDKERPSILLCSREHLRQFDQTDFGFLSTSYSDIPLAADIESLVTGDLDGDGFDELIVRSSDSSVRVYWGGPAGISAENHLLLPLELTGDDALGVASDQASIGGANLDYDAGEPTWSQTLVVHTVPDVPRIKVIQLAGRRRLFLCPGDQAQFVSFTADRGIEDVLSVDTGPVRSVAVGDLTGGGKDDLAFAARQPLDGRQASWIYWAGEGDLASRYSPKRRTAIETLSANDAMTVDLDGDGRDEVVICQDHTVRDYSTESLVVSFPDGETMPIIRRLPTHCAVDVATVRRPGGSPWVLFGNHRARTLLGNIDSYIYLGGQDGYRPDRRIEVRGWGGVEMKFIDFHDAGRPDVLLLNSNENDYEVEHPSYIFQNTPSGLNSSNPIELATHRACSSVVGDFDRTGYLDLITCGWSSDSKILIFRGGPEGLSSPEVLSHQIDGASAEHRFMTAGDLNNNGWLDLVVPIIAGEGGALIYWGGPDGFSPDRATVVPCGRIVCANLADLNDNGWLDLLVAAFHGPDKGDEHSSSVLIYWGGPEGYSNTRRMELPAYFPTDLTVADFNNDGQLDLFVSNYYAARTRDIDSYLYWAGPGGSFHPDQMTRLYHHSAHGGLAADFNEDGWIDLAVANHRCRGNHAADSYVWWNGPEGFTEKHRTDLPTLGPHGLTHSDLGNIADRGPEEYFTSRVFELRAPTTPTEVIWSGEVPPKTWVRAQVRWANTPEALACANWYGNAGVDTWLTSRSDTVTGGPASGRFVQYRLALGATNAVATPRLTRVVIQHLPPEVVA